jgi:hypothetical protein
VAEYLSPSRAVAQNSGSWGRVLFESADLMIGPGAGAVSGLMFSGLWHIRRENVSGLVSVFGLMHQIIKVIQNLK